MIIVVQTPGTKLGKKSECITIQQHTKMKEVAVRQIESVIVMVQAQVTHDALVLLAEHAVPVFYMHHGYPIGTFMPFTHHGFVLTRRAQMQAYQTDRGVQLVKAIIRGGLTNKLRLLRYYARNRRAVNPELANELAQGAANIETLIVELDSLNSVGSQRRSGEMEGEGLTPQIRASCMGLEGRGANIYFGLLTRILPHGFGFEGRNRRPPRDPVNAVLSFGYHLLQNEIMMALVAAGLEPFAGFLHTDRSGRPSLALDLIEEFRQPVVDRLVIRMVQKKGLQEADFWKEGPEAGVKLVQEAQERFVSTFFNVIRREGLKINGWFTTYQQIMLRQARGLVRYFLGKDRMYEPFQMQW